LVGNGRISREKAAQVMGVTEEMLATMLAMG